MHCVITKTRQAWQLPAVLLDRLAPFADLVARLYIARVFFLSGLSKISDWDTTMYLFEEEYKVPLLSPTIAAVLASAGELALPVLLILGLFTRFAASGLFVLNIVAVVSYYSALKGSPVALQDHLQWGILLGILMTAQVRILGIDYFIKRKLDA